VGIRFLFLAWMFALALLALIRGTRQGQVQWRLAMAVAVAAMLLELLRVLNSIPGIMFQYDTQVEMQVFAMSEIAATSVLLIGIGLSAALASGLIMACDPGVPGLLRAAPHRVWGRDAVVAAAATVSAFLLLEWCTSQIMYRASRYALAPAISLPDGIGAFVPVVSNIRDILFSALFVSAVLAFAVNLWEKTPGIGRRTLMAAGLIASLLPASATRFSEAVLGAAPAVLLVVFAYLIVKHYFRDNRLAYFTSTAVFSAARISYSMVSQGNSALLLQGWLLWILVIAGIIWLLMNSRGTASDSTTSMSRPRT